MDECTPRYRVHFPRCRSGLTEKGLRGPRSRGAVRIGPALRSAASPVTESSAARAHKRYDIMVRMNDGSVRNLSDETGKPIGFRDGDKVRVSREAVPVWG